MKKSFILSAIAALLLSSNVAGTAASKAKSTNYEFSDFYKEIRFDMPIVNRPTIPNYTINIKDFGGVADGCTKNTEAFAKAMQHLAAKGGGHLIVPAGIWLTGPINFESNVDLHLQNGALVLFSPDRADYPIVESSFEGLNTKRCLSPLSARHKENISITGSGTFNGNGQNWRPVKKGKMTENQWKDLCKNGALGANKSIWYPSERIREISEDKKFLNAAYTENKNEQWDYVHDYLRPALLSFISCKNVLLEDATFENSPGWNVHPLMCENMILNRVNIRNPWYAQNGDGLDAESCKNFLVINSTFDVGDDAICIKSGKDKDGRERNIPCENVLIEGCTVYHGHGGFVIGSEMSGGARNISVRNCLFIGTDTGLRFKSTRGRGGVVENIYIDGINMSNIAGDGLIFDLYYGIKSSDPVPAVTEETPCFKNIYIKNTLCQSAKRALYFNGLPEMPIQNIVISHSAFNAETGAVLNHVDGLTFDHVTIVPQSGEICTQQNVKNFIRK